ncbi:MAG: DUF302 domain-containing protein [Comamonadaceae bacterium]|nr:DUF302 domain-containing protein [Comamonadaceae bacterium]
MADHCYGCTAGQGSSCGRRAGGVGAGSKNSKILPSAPEPGGNHEAAPAGRATLALSAASLQASGNGMVSKPSKYLVAETVTRIEGALKAKGVTCLRAHRPQRGGREGGTEDAPDAASVFGNPKAGTPVMNAAPSAAIDLPLKALVWEDEQGKVWVAYNSPDYLKQRHGIPDDLVKNLAQLAGPLIDQALE